MRTTRLSSAMGALLRSSRTLPDGETLCVLYRLRRTYFRQQSFALYRRYGHSLMLFLALFGLLFAERPALLAAPLLHFRDFPWDPIANLAHVALWMGLVAAWAGVHRGFVRGGALAAYSRSLPLDARTMALVDLGMLGTALQVFLLPFGVAAWVVLRDGDPGGADARFWLYFPLLAALTVSTAKSVTFGRTRAATLAQAGAVATLVFAASCLPPGPPSFIVLAVLLACTWEAATLRAGDMPASPAAAGSRRPRSFRLPPPLALQCQLLLQRHRPDAALRLLLAALPQAAAWWMLVEAGKTDEARGFVQIAGALTAWFTSGFFYTFHVDSARLQPYLRSTASGERRLLLAAHALVLGATALLFAPLPLALAATLGRAHPATVSALEAGAWWLAWLPLLGLPLIQRHKDGVLFKCALVVVALLIAFNS